MIGGTPGGSIDRRDPEVKVMLDRINRLKPLCDEDTLPVAEFIAAHVADRGIDMVGVRVLMDKLENVVQDFRTAVDDKKFSAGNILTVAGEIINSNLSPDGAHIISNSDVSSAESI